MVTRSTTTAVTRSTAVVVVVAVTRSTAVVVVVAVDPVTATALSDRDRDR